MVHRLLVFVVLIAGFLPGGVAHAQPSTIVILESHGSGTAPGELARLSQRIEAQLRLRGAQLISMGRDRRQGAAPTSSYDTPQAARAALERLSDGAVDALAREENERADTLLGEARELIATDLEGLARTPEGATRVIDTCLLGTRLSHALGRAAEARERTLECRRWAPSALPSQNLHPPEVRAILEEIDHEITGQNAGTLDVDADSPRCLVRVNGAPVGRTPARSLRLPRGEYSVQVECGEEHVGAIHRVTLGPEPVNLRVDAGLQQAAHSAPCLGLRYPDAATAEGRILHHARGLARVASAEQLLLIRPSDNAGEHALLLLEVGTGHTIWEGSVRQDTDDATLADTLVAIVHPSQTQDAAPPAETESPLSPPTDEAPQGTYPPIAQSARLAGYSLLGASGVAFAVAGAYLAHLGTNIEQFEVAEPNDIDFQERRDAMDATRLMATLFSAGGGALGSVGTALLLRGAHSTPLWAWLTGAAGLGALGGGLALMFTAPSCDGGAAPNPSQRADCGSRARTFNLGVGLASLGAPLLTIPLTYLLKSPTNGTEAQTNANFRLRVDATGATLSLEGHL